MSKVQYRPLSTVSRRLQALQFIRDHWAACGAGPSYGNIAGALGCSKERARELVAGLADEGLVIKVPGRGGILLPERQDAVLRELAKLGWRVNGTTMELAPPLPNTGLPMLPAFVHVAPDDFGDHHFGGEADGRAAA